MDHAATGIDAQDESVLLRTVLQALQGGDTIGFEASVERVGVEALLELAASEYGVEMANIPRRLLPADHRLVIIHSIARVYRYTGDVAYLDGELYQALVSSLQHGDLDWAEPAARNWYQLVMHTGEAPMVWPQAHALLTRFPEQVGARPGVLGAIATLAATSGVEEAAELWERVLAHPALGDRAERRWELELDWARCWLMLGGGELARAITVLARVRRGLGESGSVRSEIDWTNATIELVGGLTWAGRAQEALEVVEDSLRRVEPGGELEAWITLVGAFPAAAVGDVAAVRSAELVLERTSTDTSSIRLRALICGKLLLAGANRDLALLQDVVREARTIEAGRPMDPEICAAWRVHAAEAAVITDDRALARTLLADLTTTLDDVACDLPIHRMRRDHVAHALSVFDVPESDLDAREEFARRATELGMALPDLAPTQRRAGAARATADHALRFQLLGPFRVERDGQALSDHVWGGRRQARLLLALLLAHGGRLDMDTVVDTLWGDIDPRIARARVAPLCNTLRSVIAEAGSSTPERAVLVRGGSITLQLHERDHSDLEELRSVVARVRREPARARDVALGVFDSVRERPIDDLGTDHPAELVRGLITQEVQSAVPVLAAAWDGVAAPPVVINTVSRLLSLEPTDTSVCARLMSLLRDAGDVPGASTAFHATRTALREELGLAPPVGLARLHAAMLVADGRADDVIAR